jgi:DNA-binding transcriptional regulator YiaG
MSTNTETKVRNRWDERTYSRIDRARCDWEGTVLTVDFENGDRAQLDPKLLLPRSARPEEVDWWRIGSNGFEILIPIGQSWFEVPWDVIRDITDDEFSEHWTKMEQEIVKNRGERIRELRELQELSVEELASRAGVTTDDVIRIESGTHEPQFDPTAIITALGRKWLNLYDVIAVEDDLLDENC